MHIEVHKMFLCHNKPEMKAVCSITLNNEFNINDVRVIETFNKRLLVVMPGKFGADSKFYDLVHPIKQNVREELERVVLEEYKQKIKTTGGKTNE